MTLSEDGNRLHPQTRKKKACASYLPAASRQMNMSGVIQVGKPVNKAKAQAVVDEMENRAMQSKGRLKKNTWRK